MWGRSVYGLTKPDWFKDPTSKNIHSDSPVPEIFKSPFLCLRRLGQRRCSLKGGAPFLIVPFVLLARIQQICEAAIRLLLGKRTSRFASTRTTSAFVHIEFLKTFLCSICHAARFSHFLFQFLDFSASSSLSLTDAN